MINFILRNNLLIGLIIFIISFSNKLDAVKNSMSARDILLHLTHGLYSSFHIILIYCFIMLIMKGIKNGNSSAATLNQIKRGKNISTGKVISFPNR